jgi:hypothetical protein
MMAVVAGAAGSLAFTLRAGRRNDSRVLLTLFGMWVLSPFIALLLADRISRGWSILTRATLYSLTLILGVASLAIYGDVAFGPPRAKPAFVFVIVPPASWLLIVIVVLIAAVTSGRLSRRGRGAS